MRIVRSEHTTHMPILCVVRTVAGTGPKISVSDYVCSQNFGASAEEEDKVSRIVM